MASNNNQNKYTTQQIKELIIQEAARRNIDPAILLSIAEHESGFNPNAKNFSNVEKSYGLFQINTKAHPDYKGGFDVKQNIMYGAGVFADAFKKANGNVEKALAIYNGGVGGQKASIRNGYPKAVMSKVNKHRNNTVPNSAYITNKSQKGTVSNMATNNNNNNNILTGEVTATNASTDRPSMLDLLLEANNLAYNRNVNKLQMPSAINQDFYIQNMIDNNFDRESVQRAQAANVDFATLKIRLGIPEGQAAPWEVVTTTAGEGLRGKTPLSRAENIRQNYENIAEQNYINQLNVIDRLNNPQAQAQQRANMRQMLQDNYNQFYTQADVIAAQDPRLQNRGYYIDPQQINQAALNNAALTGYFGMPQIQSPQQLAQQQYEAQIANQYGVPYQQAMDAMQQGFNMKLALFENQINMQLQQDIANAKTQQDIQKAYIDAERARADARKAAYDSQLAEENVQRANRQQLMNTGIVPMQQGINTLSNTNLTTGVDLTNAYLGNLNQQQIEANKLRSAEDIARLQSQTDLEKQQRQFNDPTYQMGGQAKFMSASAEAAGWNPQLYAQNIGQTGLGQQIYPTGTVNMNLQPQQGSNQDGGLRIPQVNFNLGGLGRR